MIENNDVAQPVTNDQVRNEVSQYNYARKAQKTVTQEDINKVMNSKDIFLQALMSDVVITKVKHVLEEDRKPSPTVYASPRGFRRQTETKNTLNLTLKSKKGYGDNNQTASKCDANRQKRGKITATEQIIDSDSYQDEFLTLMIRERQAARRNQSSIIEVA